jgi:hypothetical protein
VKLTNQLLLVDILRIYERTLPLYCVSLLVGFVRDKEYTLTVTIGYGLDMCADSSVMPTASQFNSLLSFHLCLRLASCLFHEVIILRFYPGDEGMAVLRNDAHCSKNKASYLRRSASSGRPLATTAVFLQTLLCTVRIRIEHTT